MAIDMSISVIGGSKATPQVLDIAEQVGWELATRGVRVVCGGLPGVTVVSLNTWSFSINGEICPAIVLASTPIEAVDMAISAAQLRKN